MLWVTCPNCGHRPAEEFRYGSVFPVTPDHITDPELRNVDYAWMTDNIDGETLERWFHEAGCRRWFTAKRNTRTDAWLDIDEGMR
jgi:heterotetrameric sarcosine oxidase delta subunit